MPTERLSMRRIRQVLQLHFGARSSARVVAGTVGIGRSTVQDYLARAAAAGLVWPLPAELTDEALEQLLFPAPSNRPGARRFVEPDWSVLVREMKRPGVNLSVLFDEYRGSHPDGYAYSRYVTAKIMLRLLGGARNTADFPGSIHNIEEGDRRSTRPSRTPAMMAGWVPVAGLSGR